MNEEEVDNEIKISIPIISNQEIENIINTEDLYDKIAEQIYHDREMIILQEFIKKLQKENKELNKKLILQKGISDYWCEAYMELQKERERKK